VPDTPFRTPILTPARLYGSPLSGRHARPLTIRTCRNASRVAKDLKTGENDPAIA